MPLLPIKHEIVTSGFLVASYLESINFNKTVYLIGSRGLADELSSHGIKHTGVGVSYIFCK